ncbi:MAG: hypothetical protein ACO3K7_00630 [Candidatus Marinamargulisbacteria bacterium]
MLDLSLLELYEALELEVLQEKLTGLCATDVPVPLADMVAILEDTLAIELVAMIIDVWVARMDDVDDALMKIHYPRTNDIVKRHIILALSKTLRSKHMQFLLDEYVHNPYMRPDIRKMAFGHKSFLWMNLVRYFESVPFTENTLAIAQQLLQQIPRSVVLDSGNVFSGTRLMDVYYATETNDEGLD